ncbi:MAG: hypothetical protein RR365_00640 [Bacteroides sp.]
MNRTGSPMYLRTGNLFKDFIVEKKSEITTARGRVTSGYENSTGDRLSAVLADATPEERERWDQQQHSITHTLTQRGKPHAREGDRLIFGNRLFYIQGIEEPGDIGIWTIYYTQERSDAADGN